MPRLTDVYPRRISSPRVVGMLGGGGLTTIWPGFTWYVDSVNGNDANTGRSAAEAFQTITALMAAGIAAWDQIGLASDSHWRSQLDITVDHVTVQAYGSGARPHLDCRDILDNASFALTGGTANVYEISVTNDNTGANCWVRAWEDGAGLVRVANVAACDAAPGSYYPSSDTLQNITLYVHPTGSTNPTVDGKVYEHNKRLRGLGSQTASNLTIRGIQTSGNLDGNGSMVIGRSTEIYDCVVAEGQKHNILVGDGCYLKDVVADEAYYGTTSSSMFVYNDTNPTGLGVTFEDCIAQLAVYDAYVGAFYGHVNVGGTFGSVVYIGCNVVNMGTAYGGQDATMQLINCDASGILYYLNQRVNATITGGTVSLIDLARGLTPNVDGLTLSIDGLTVTATRTLNGGALYSTRPWTVTMQNCSFESVGAGGFPQCVYLSVNTITLNAQNCTYTNWVYVYRTPVNGGVITSDYNTFDDGNQKMIIENVTYNTIALYVTATGQDTHSTIL